MNCGPCVHVPVEVWRGLYAPPKSRDTLTHASSSYTVTVTFDASACAGGCMMSMSEDTPLALLLPPPNHALPPGGEGGRGWRVTHECQVSYMHATRHICMSRVTYACHEHACHITRHTCMSRVTHDHATSHVTCSSCSTVIPRYAQPPHLNLQPKMYRVYGFV